MSNISVLPHTGETVIECPTHNLGRFFQGFSFPGPGSYTKPTSFWSYAFAPGKIGVEGTITDETNHMGQFNTCNHSQTEWQCFLQHVTMMGSCTIPGASVTTSCYVGAANAVEFGINSAPFMASDDELLNEAVTQMHPQVVKPVFDAALQIGEALELAHCLKKGMDLLSKLQDDAIRRNKWNSPLVRRLLKQRSYESLSLRDWAQLVIALDLGYKFAIKPTIDAVQQLHSSFWKAYRQLEKYEDSIQVLHGSAVRTSFVTHSFDSSAYEYSHWGNQITFKIEVHTTARIKYQNTFTGEQITKILTQLMGIRPTSATAWELMPLSFVVDWFADFGSYLAAWCSPRNKDIKYTVLESGFSRKATASSEGWVDLCAGSLCSSFRSVQAPPLVRGTLTKTVYHREPCALDWDTVDLKPINVRWPTAAKLATLAELAFSIKSGYRKLLRSAV